MLELSNKLYDELLIYTYLYPISSIIGKTIFFQRLNSTIHELKKMFINNFMN